MWASRLQSSMTMTLSAFAAQVVFPSSAWPRQRSVDRHLAATDAALGGCRRGRRYRCRCGYSRALDVESGLNDGMARRPLVAVFLAVVVAGASAGPMG